MISNDILKVMVVGLLFASSGASASSIVSDVSQVVSTTGSIGETGATALGTTGSWSLWRRGSFLHWALRGSFFDASGDVETITRGSILVGSGGFDKKLHGSLFPGSAAIERGFRGSRIADRRSRNHDGAGQVAIAAVESVQLTEPGSMALVGLGIAALVFVRGRKRRVAAA
jgi:hypothetical protein